MVSKVKKHERVTRKELKLEWSLMTYNVVQMLRHINKFNRYYAPLRLRDQNPALLILTHQLVDQLMNENIARNYSINLSNIDSIKMTASEKKNVGLNDQEKALGVMSTPFSSSKNKIAKYAELFQLSLREEIFEFANKLCDIRDFIYHTDVFSFHEGDVPKVVHDFLTTSKNTYSTARWDAELVLGSYMEDVFSIIEHEIMPNLIVESLGDACAFKRACTRYRGSAGRYVKQVAESGVLMGETYKALRFDGREKFEKLLQGYLEENNLQLIKRD